MPHNKTINIIRFAHWEKASLSLCFSRYCKRYVLLTTWCSNGVWMNKLFYSVLFICIVLTDSDLIRAVVYVVNGTTSIEESFKFIDFDGVEDQIYILLGKILIFIGVFISIALYKRKEELPKQLGMWLSLIISCGFYWFAVWGLWLPIANGQRMSSTFAIAFIFITLYSNIAGLLGGALGYYFGKWLNKKHITS
jgi:hypothetical protein